MSLSLAVVFICIMFLALWLFDRSLERRKRVLGCTHERIEVRRLRPEHGGTLFLQCECGYQAHLRGLRSLPDGTWWLMSGKDWEEAEIEYLKAYHKHDRKPEPLS